MKIDLRFSFDDGRRFSIAWSFETDYISRWFNPEWKMTMLMARWHETWLNSIKQSSWMMICQWIKRQCCIILASESIVEFKAFLSLCLNWMKRFWSIEDDRCRIHLTFNIMGFIVCSSDPGFSCFFCVGVSVSCSGWSCSRTK